MVCVHPRSVNKSIDLLEMKTYENQALRRWKEFENQEFWHGVRAAPEETKPSDTAPKLRPSGGSARYKNASLAKTWKTV